MKETIDLLGKILTNILTALYVPFGFSLLLSFLAMFFYLYKDTFKMYTDMFLTEYIILAIHLNSQGALPDMVLNKVKENANLMV